MRKVSQAGGLTILGALVFLVGQGITSFGHADQPFITYRWSPPSVGSPVDHYVGQHRLITLQGDTATIYIPVISDTTYTVDYQWGSIQTFRVAGVDSLDRQGAWSSWSAEWIDHGPPGQPGDPEQTLLMQ